MISAVVLTKNEENNIVDCIESLLWCDEIVIIDDYSTDKTLDLLKRIGSDKISVFQRSIAGDFAAQRNFGLQKAKGEWVFFVDADERVSHALHYEVLHIINNLSGHTAAGYRVQRIDTLWGKKLLHGETGNIKLLRLAKRTVGTWHGKVHEVWKIQGRVEDLSHPLSHYPHPTIVSFLQEINYYTDLRAKELFDKGKTVQWWSIIAYPKAKFFLNYVLKRGFLDGIQGFIVAVLMSFHSFLVRGKLWQLHKS